jgi:hypothetical protein
LKGEKMKNKKVLLLSLIVTLLISAWVFNIAMAAPLSDDDTYAFTVINDSEKGVTVTLTGSTESYEIEVEKGDKESIQVVPDEYLVEYPSCDDILDFDADLTEKGYSLHLYPCAHQPSKLQIKSHLSEDVVLELFGYKDYEIDIKPGFNRKKMFAGIYTYSYEACDGQVFSGEVTVGKLGISQFYLHSCEWFSDPVRVYGSGSVVNFKIIDHASFPLILTLIGPENYLVTVNPGVNIFTMVAGTYKYSYYLDYKIHTGTMLVTKNGTGSLVLSPSYVYSFVDDTELE